MSEHEMAIFPAGWVAVIVTLTSVAFFIAAIWA